ncbi:MAG: phytanoyl-CoA dioxygenase family protein [candidate division Zixibacteria bacterium]|nr:phytanoyl-CoA dioxygenase family protein [candidate division Zixibacteria bacterium]
MKPFQLTDELVVQFDRDGYILVENLFDKEEMDLLLKIGKADQEKADIVHAAKDAEGRESKLWLVSDIDRQDIYNGFCHCRRIVDTMERLMEDEVYLYHYKMMVKEPRVGGAWEWHQDYGYWYHNECLYPDMASCYIAVDRAYRGNGCLQVLRGSHRMGRIEHGRFGTQTGADPGRVELAMEHLDLVYCEMSPGSALFFHANLLHRSDPNTSDDPRWSLICCYNTKHNPCKDRVGHPSYVPLEKWDDSRIKEFGRRQWTEMTVPA